MRLTLLCILFLTTYFSYAQVLSGTAKDANTKKGLAYASVQINGTNFGALTDENGYFEVDISSTKSDTLFIQYIGYERKKLSIDSLKNNSIILLTPNDHKIEAVIVTPVDADHIMQLVRENYITNHIKLDHEQEGFSRSFYYNESELFEIAESNYHVVHQKTKKGVGRKIKANKSRMVIDSAIYKRMNDIFRFKKDTMFIEPINFLNIGQQFDSNRNERQGRVDEVFEYIDQYNYQEREVYEILRKSYRKDVLFLETTYLIDKEKYAIHSWTFKTKDQDALNNTIPFTTRALLSVFGYKFRVNSIDGYVYYRYNGDFFELDKGSYVFKTDVARGGQWLNGSMNQEFYLLDSKAIIEGSNNNGLNRSEIVYDFDPNYFNGLYHLPTTKKTKSKIKNLQGKNASFDQADFQSDRFRKWIKKGKETMSEGVVVDIY